MSDASANEKASREDKSDGEASAPEAALPPAEGADDAADAPEIEPIPGEPPPLPVRQAKVADDEAGLLKTTPNLPARAWPPSTLGDLMTRKVITVQEDEPVGDLEAWMARFRFHHLPVVTSELKLIGLITRTDFLHALLGITPTGAPTDKVGPETKAGTIMRRNVVTGTPATPLVMACRVMLQQKLGCLPIVLKDTTLVGIVTQADLVRLAADLLEKPA